MGISKVKPWFPVRWLEELAGYPVEVSSRHVGIWNWPLNQTCQGRWSWCEESVAKSESWSTVKIWVPGGFRGPWSHNSQSGNSSSYSVLWSYAPGQATHINCINNNAPFMPSSCTVAHTRWVLSAEQDKMYKDSHLHVKWERGKQESVDWYKMGRMKRGKFQGVLGPWCHMF